MEAKRMQDKRLIDGKIILIVISSLTFTSLLFFRPGITKEKNNSIKNANITKINYTQQKEATNIPAPKIEEVPTKEEILETNKEVIQDQVDTSITTTEQPISPEPVVPPVGLELHSNDKVYGDKNSKVVIIEYSSPTCPHCAYYHKEVFPIIKKKYIDEKKIAYILRLFITNKLDLDAAVIPYCDCALDNEKFLKWFDTILNSQQNWMLTNGNHLAPLTTIGEIGGLTKEKYEACLKDNCIASILIENNRAALTHPKFKSSPGTPAFFINGKKHEEPYSAEILSKALDKALEEAETNSKTDG